MVLGSEQKQAARSGRCEGVGEGGWGVVVGSKAEAEGGCREQGEEEASCFMAGQEVGGELGLGREWQGAH